MALTNDSELADRMQRYRSHGVSSNPDHMQLRPIDEIWNYQQIRLGFNYRMTDIAGALGISQLDRLDAFINRRHEIASRYDICLKDLPLKSPWQNPQIRSSYHLYPVRIPYQTYKISQKTVYLELIAAGINVNVHYIPVYRQPYYEALGFAKGYCPESELYFREPLSLPIYPGLTDAEQTYVIETLTSVLQSK